MKALLIALLLVGITFSSGLSVAMEKYLEPGIAVDEVIVLRGENWEAYIIVIDNQEMLLIGNWSWEAVQDEEGILNVLEENARVSANFSGAKEEVLESISELGQVRNEPERLCGQYTGLDRFPCIDKETCRRAAEASPQSSEMIYAPGFWEEMLAWSADRKELDNTLLMLETMANSSEWGVGFSEKMAGNISKAIAIMNRLEQNGLVLTGSEPACEEKNCFFYCPQVEWPYAKWQGMKSRWDGIAQELQEDKRVERAQKIYLRTKAWTEYLQNRESEFAGIRGNLTDEIKKIGIMLSNSSQIWEDKELEQEFSEFRHLSAQAIASGEAGQYRDALLLGEELLQNASMMQKKIENNNRMHGLALKALANVEKGIAEIKKAGGGTSTLEAKYGIIGGKLEGRAKASELPRIVKDSEGLEKEVLLEVAKSQLGIGENGESSGNGTAKAGKGGNIDSGETPKDDAQAPMCFSAIASILAGLGISIAWVRKK